MNIDLKRRDVILVVDDSPDTLRLLTDALDGAGMTVMVAMDGSAALRIIDQITPDMILLDAIMPGIDGFETCRLLKSNTTLGNVPVIFMTGLSDTEHIVRGLEAGGVDYVTKPIVIQEMLARIRVHLANARVANSAHSALDVSGRYLLAINGSGELLWATPQARKFLSDHHAEEAVQRSTLKEELTAWLLAVQGMSGRKPFAFTLGQNKRTRLQYLGKLGPDENLVRLAQADSPDMDEDYSRKLGLTNRESEVLSWLSKGKTNRDIAQILGLSPRTIDKHLEQIYAKLGVENRTAAAAVAADARRS